MSDTSHNAAPPIPLSAKARRTVEQPISYLIDTAMRTPGLINLAAGLVDPLTLPVEETVELTETVLGNPPRGRATLQYDTTLGLAPLRETLLTHIETLEGKPAGAMSLRANDIIVTTGSQQALYLVGDALVDPGDIVIAESPSYFVYTGTLQSLGADVRGVRMTDDGMDVEALDRLLTNLDRQGQLERVKLVYCTSYYQNPTGLTLSAASRPKLLEVVKRHSHRHRILILEDAAYRELRYDGEALPSIKSYDADNHYTILAQTFSKPFAPGIKTGYAALPSDLMDAIIQQKGNHDFGSSNLCQNIALEAMRSGMYARHVEKLKQSYRAKRDRMLVALDRLMPTDAGITWTTPHGGLYVWVTLPEHVDTSREGALFNDCVHRGVLYVPGDYCFSPDDQGRVPRHQLRLSFGQVSLEQIEPGIERLALAVRDQLRDGASKSSHRPSTSAARVTAGPRA